ncbi:caspase-3-like isoform X1 [Ptychodera flava]|uniref:caspase-3-like isoform X1 n=1 Tax=Ptychodera flava TaxID=63121 RepID=UPI00396AAE8B
MASNQSDMSPEGDSEDAGFLGIFRWETKKSSKLDVTSSFGQLKIQESSPDESQNKAEGTYSCEDKKSKTVKASSIDDILERDNVYSTSHVKRGRALIINNRDFEPKTRMNRRNGTDIDRDNIRRTFSGLGFNVTTSDNLKVREMHGELIELSKENHTDSDCVAVVILSHGDDGIIYGTDGTTPVEELTKYFSGENCETLVGKPKLFFLQACRGKEFDDGVVLKSGIDQTDAAPVAQRLPVQADFLICYSTVPGYYSWRNTENGSWFIQAICKVFDRYGQDMDVLQMMTKVSRIVAYSFESSANSPSNDKKKQIPCTVSMLTKDLLFTPKTTPTEK